MSSNVVRTLLIAAVCSVMLAACGNKAKEGGATQVVAKVNKTEVTVHQLNNALTRLNFPADQRGTASRQVLERLIGRELLVEQALKNKLDRDPRLVQALEESRRDIIASFYLQQVAAKVATPSDQEIHDYFSKHPEMFAQRRIYKLRQLVVDAAGDRQAQVKAEYDKNPRLEAIEEWLKTQNIRFVVNDIVKKAEEIPQDAQSRFAAMKDGDITVSTVPNAMAFLQIIASQNQPLDEAAAKPHITQILENQRRGELQQAELKRLKDAAKIEYMGEFKTDASAPKSPSQDIEKGLKGIN